MSLYRRWIFLILLGGVALGWAVALSAALPERKTFQFGEFTIEATSGDEVYVEALAKLLADYHLPEMAPPPVPRLALADLEKRRDYFLVKISAYLGLAQPTDDMKSTFDDMGRIWREMSSVTQIKLPTRFSIWRRSELVARIDGGGKIPGFSKDAAGQVKFTFQSNDDPKPEMTPQQYKEAMDEEWKKFVWPVDIDSEPNQAPEQDAASGLQLYNETMTLMRSQEMHRTSVFTVLHEATEVGVVWHYLGSKDRRWFCDGIANYVAWKVIESELGPEEARGYYDLPAELKKYANDAVKIDLASWPAVENLKQANYAENLDTANYAFATKVIADVCAKHGDSILPKLFAEIGKTPYEKATMDTVYRAFKKLTREDLRSYLPKPVAKR